MTTSINRQILLAARPDGFPKDTDFRAVESPVPEPGPGQMLCRTIYLSLDPYMRGRMNAGRSYAKALEVGDVMTAGTVSRVVTSHLDGFTEGDYVLLAGGWQDYAVSDGQGVRKLDPALAPLSTAVGVLGMPGHTAYVGLLDIGQPKAGETVVVSAASGAVGSVVGQIARIKGCRVVGVAGVQEKCDYVVDELGFDACVSHRSQTLREDLEAACPDGIDVYFENVARQSARGRHPPAERLRAHAGLWPDRHLQHDGAPARPRPAPRAHGAGADPATADPRVHRLRPPGPLPRLPA